MARGFPLALCTAFVLAVVCRAGAQTSTGTILGTVRDGQGGVLPGTAVSAIDSDTSRRVDVITDDSGSYVIAQLPAGRYLVEATRTGFKVSRHDSVIVQ